MNLALVLTVLVPELRGGELGLFWCTLVELLGLASLIPFLLFPVCCILRSETLLEKASNSRYRTSAMNGYLNESNFMMVEEGFTTRDLLENLLVEPCQAVRADARCSLGRGWHGEASAAHCSFPLG